MNELKKTKNEQFYILTLLQIKAKLKLDLRDECEKQIKLLVSENPQIKILIEADSELRPFID